MSTLEHKTCDILAAELLRLMRFDITDLSLIPIFLYFDKSRDLFGSLFQKERVLCCSIISIGKTRAPAVLTGIL